MRIRIFVIQLVGVDGCESYLTDIIFWKLNRLIKKSLFYKTPDGAVEPCTGGVLAGPVHLTFNIMSNGGEIIKNSSNILTLVSPLL